MKKCSYCGRENPDEAVHCRECGTEFERPSAPHGPPPPPEPKKPEYTFKPLSEADKQKDLVTLVVCGTLLAADIVVSRLSAAGIEAFIPDEYLMQAVGFNFNTFGYVRVQIRPKDYAAARDLLTGIDQDA